MRRAPDPAVGRLTKRPEFLAAAGGRRFHTERLTVQALRREGPGGPRFGFTVTRKVGHATERNRIRRRLRAAVAEVSGALGGASLDLVLVGRRPSLQAPFDTLLADLERAFHTLLRSQDARGPRPPRSAKRADPAP